MQAYKKEILLIFFIFPYLEISIRHISFNTNLAWRAIPALIGFITFGLRLKEDFILEKNSFSSSKRNFIFFISLYSFSMIFSAIYHNCLSSGILYTYIIYIGMFLYLDLWMDEFESFSKVMCVLFMAIILLSFILGIISPSKAFVQLGSEKSFVGALGEKNAVQLCMLPAIGIFLIRYHLERTKKNQYVIAIFIALAIIFLFVSKSGTAAIASSLLIVYLLVGRKVKISFMELALIYVAIYFLVVIFRIQEVFFYDLIVNVLHKDITLSGRTDIWDFVIPYIIRNPIVGEGPINYLIGTHFYGVNEVHNGFLDILFQGGSLSLICFCCVIGTIGRHLDDYRDNMIASIVLFFIFIYSIIALTESAFGYSKMLFWMMLIIGLNIEKVIKKTEKGEET